MQIFRKSVATGVVLALALGTSALAAPSQEDRKEPPRSREVRKSEKPPNQWIERIVRLLELQDWPSIPPG